MVFAKHKKYICFRAAKLLYLDDSVMATIYHWSMFSNWNGNFDLVTFFPFEIQSWTRAWVVSEYILLRQHCNCCVVSIFAFNLVNYVLELNKMLENLSSNRKKENRTEKKEIIKRGKKYVWKPKKWFEIRLWEPGIKKRCTEIKHKNKLNYLLIFHLIELTLSECQIFTRI